MAVNTPLNPLPEAPVTHTMASLSGFRGYCDIDYLKSYFGEHSATIRKICICESGQNPNAVLHNSREWSIGLLMINTYAHPEYDKEKLKDPDYNLKAGKEILDLQGYGAWRNCYNKIK